MLWMRQRKQQPNDEKSECIAKCLYTRYTLVIRGATIKPDKFIFRFAHDSQCCVNLIVDVLHWIRCLASIVQPNQTSESCSMRLHHFHQTLAAFRSRHDEKIPMQSQSEWETASRTGIEIARRMAAKKKENTKRIQHAENKCIAFKMFYNCTIIALWIRWAVNANAWRILLPLLDMLACARVDSTSAVCNVYPRMAIHIAAETCRPYLHLYRWKNSWKTRANSHIHLIKTFILFFFFYIFFSCAPALAATSVCHSAFVHFLFPITICSER